MRTAFIRTLETIARNDPSVMLLTGDLGFLVLEPFRDALPNQYLNCGVSEQNMISVAAGLAHSGKRVFVYSIIPFVTFRCLEQTRNDVCYHKLPVCIVGVGAGYSYGHQGATHHSMEDIAVMRSLANMTVICPGDPLEAEAAVHAIHKLEGPCYLRLCKAGEPNLHPAPPAFTIGKGMRLQEGTEVTILSMSSMLQTAMQVGKMLAEKGISTRVVSMPTVKPIDEEEIARAGETKLLVTIEEHSPIGGFGSAVSEARSRIGQTIPHLACTGPITFTEQIGSPTYLRKQVGLDPETIFSRIQHAL